MSNARATLCELLASRILRRFHEDNPTPSGLLLLANILVAGFDPFQGAPAEVETSGRRIQWPIQKRGGYEKMLTALELAIISESKHLASSSAFQRLVNAVYSGKVIYTPLSFFDILPDHYKHKPPSLYNPRKAPMLNHYRLIVPRTRTIIEIFQFTLLLGLFVLLMMNRNSKDSLFYEVLFDIYAVGWILEEFAALLEHGWNVHLQKLWSFLDVTFAAIFLVYLCLRFDMLFSVRVSRQDALNVLCIAAPVLLPRLAFNLMRENIIFISLHAMMKDFTRLTFLAVWCFLGFLLSLQWLIDGEILNEDTPNWATILKWLLWLWFGLDGTGIERSIEFNRTIGPALMVSFTFLGSSLFLTILVAMLTSTFSGIIADQIAEIHFRRAVLTFAGVKSDAIFAYPPPFNIAALCLLLPLKFVLTPRWFHKVNVTIVRALNCPLLLAINIYERRRLWHSVREKKTSRNGLLRSLYSWNFTGFSPHGDVQAVFQTPPKATRDAIDALDTIDEDDDFSSDAIEDYDGTEDGDDDGDKNDKNDKNDEGDDEEEGESKSQTSKGLAKQKKKESPPGRLNRASRSSRLSRTDDRRQSFRRRQRARPRPSRPGHLSSCSVIAPSTMGLPHDERQ